MTTHILKHNSDVLCGIKWNINSKFILMQKYEDVKECVNICKKCLKKYNEKKYN